MWQIVDTSERTQKHCMMMENVNYGREELMYLNMCRQGVIGELLHGEAAYIHDLRFQMEEQDRGTGSWRTHQYAQRNGNLYPTHGLGPVAQYMSIGRTQDTFQYTRLLFYASHGSSKLREKELSCRSQMEPIKICRGRHEYLHNQNKHGAYHHDSVG